MSLCSAENSQLIVVDIQERLVAAIPAEDVDATSKASTLLLDVAAILGIPVVRSEQYPQGLGKTITAIEEHLPVASANIVKTCFSCAGDADFREATESSGRDQVVLTGMESHVCILQTAMELQQRGKDVFVVEDAICARRKANHENAIERMRRSDIVITNAESVIFEWLRDSSHDHFREISALLKAHVSGN